MGNIYKDVIHLKNPSRHLWYSIFSWDFYFNLVMHPWNASQGAGLTLRDLCKHLLRSGHHLYTIRSSSSFLSVRERETGNEQLRGKVPAGWSGPDVADVECSSAGTSFLLSCREFRERTLRMCFRLNAACSVGASTFTTSCSDKHLQARSTPRGSPGSWCVYKRIFPPVSIQWWNC